MIDATGEIPAEVRSGIIKRRDLHAAHSCTWLLLGRCTGSDARAMSNGRGNLFGSIYYLARARKGKPLPSGRTEEESRERKQGRTNGRTDGRPEDYIRSPRKRNIERNLIMSTTRARAHALSKHIRGQDFYSSSESEYASGKRFSCRCGKQSFAGDTARRELRRTTRVHWAHWEITFPGFFQNYWPTTASGHQCCGGWGK